MQGVRGGEGKVCVALLSSCSSLASHCSDFSCCRAQALGAGASVVRALRAPECGLSAQLRHKGLAASWHVGIFPDEGLSPPFLHW